MPKRIFQDRAQEVGYLQTRAPQALYDYAIWLSRSPALGYRTVAKLWEIALTRFTDEKVWEQPGFAWQHPRSVGSGAGASQWIQVNIQVRRSDNPATQFDPVLNLRGRIQAAAEACGVSVAVYAYTVLVWVCTVLHPPREA